MMLANGLSGREICRQFGLSGSSLGRHRHNCLGLPTGSAVKQQAAQAQFALASLPSIDEVGGAYSNIGTRIDAISARAEREGSLAVALMGLKELRSTTDSMARLAGHIGTGTQLNVQTNVSVDVGAIVQGLAAAIMAAPAPEKAVERLSALVDAEDPR
jgi:hypothetical protein